jgi:RecA-family ATPase
MLTLFGAAPGAGKSFVSLDLAWRITSGGKFPDGKPVPNTGKVIYVDAEAVPQILNERAQNYGVNRKHLFLLLPDPGEVVDFGGEKYRDRLINMTATLHPDLVIIDSLSSIHTRGQNNVEDVRDLLSFLTQLAESYRVGLLLIHHIRKPASGQNIQMYDLSMSDLSGSGHIVAMARVVWGLHTSPGRQCSHRDFQVLFVPKTWRYLHLAHGTRPRGFQIRLTVLPRIFGKATLPTNCP